MDKKDSNKGGEIKTDDPNAWLQGKTYGDEDDDDKF